MMFLLTSAARAITYDGAAVACEDLFRGWARQVGTGQP